MFYIIQRFISGAQNFQTNTCTANMYLKVPKFLDARKFCCNLPKIQTKWPKLRVFYQNNANGIANSEDPDQTLLKEQSDLGLHCLPRPICGKNLGSLRYMYFKIHLYISCAEH